MSINPAPYPADTKAKGWRFELDYERIDQSGTWALASRPSMEVCRPLLLMQWYVAWHQEPCGTLPSDEEVIAALMGISDKTWKKHRAVLMRGWWLADDGLLYHPTITKRVLEMTEYRRKTAERVAKHKSAKREQQEGNALPTAGETVKNDTGTGTGTGTYPKSIDDDVHPAAPSSSDQPVSKQPDADPVQLRTIELAILLRKHGASVHGSNPDVIAMAREGFSDADALGALQAAQQQRQDSTSTQPISASYLLAICRNQRGKAQGGASKATRLHAAAATVFDEPPTYGEVIDA